jgi:hypothetical protein
MTDFVNSDTGYDLRRRELSGAKRLSAPCNIFRLPFGSAGVVVRISATRATRIRLVRSRDRVNCSTWPVGSSSQVAVQGAPVAIATNHATHAASLDHHSDPPVQRSGLRCG